MDSLLIGKIAFIAVFATVFFWILFLPRNLLAEEEANAPWYRNVRFWAAFVAAAQMGVYMWLG